jgi:hypothetical protein
MDPGRRKLLGVVMLSAIGYVALVIAHIDFASAERDYQLALTDYERAMDVYTVVESRPHSAEDLGIVKLGVAASWYELVTKYEGLSYQSKIEMDFDHLAMHPGERIDGLPDWLPRAELKKRYDDLRDKYRNEIRQYLQQKTPR